MSAPFDLALVVDDDPDIALAARLALRDLFARVETLPAPELLPALLKKESPDVILLDLNFERGATDGREGLDYLGRIMAIDPAELSIDASYQRDLSKKSLRLIQTLVKDWDWRRYKIPVVARVDDAWHVIDGQHTAIAALTHGGIG